MREITLRERCALRGAAMAELQTLEQQISALARSFDDIVAGQSLVNTDDEYDPEGSTIAFERSQVSALLRQAKDDRTALLMSLTRMDEPGYGVCEVCKEFIGVERLLVLPAATKCINCAR